MPLQQEDETVYQLAHERMIPAVIKLSGKILPRAYKANELLNKRVKMWMDNDYSSRYLLTLQELWLIEQQKSYLMGGERQQQKEKLIKRSKQRIYRNFGIFGGIAIFGMGFWGWLTYTTSGQLTQIRYKLTKVSQQSSTQYQAQAVTAFAKDLNFDQALEVANSIEGVGMCIMLYIKSVTSLRKNYVLSKVSIFSNQEKWFSSWQTMPFV